MGAHRKSFRTPQRHRASRLVTVETTLPSSGFCTLILAFLGLMVLAGIEFGAVRVVPDEPAAIVTADAPVAVVSTVAWRRDR